MSERGTQCAPPVERRPVAVASAQRSAVVASRPVLVRTTPGVAQCAGSASHDAAEVEAHATARRVVSGPGVAVPSIRAAHPGGVQRAAAPPAAATAAASSASAAGSGTALPAGVRTFMESRFAADFGAVRVHTDDAAAKRAESLKARAFTVGSHVYFGQNQFKPESESGRELIAHELTHTIQQGAVAQGGGAAMPVAERTPPRVQRWGVGDALDAIAEKANLIPGFRLLCVVLGMNPINFAAVARDGPTILRALFELIPVTGPMLVRALDGYGIIARVGTWFEVKVRGLGLAAGAIKAALDAFVNSLSWRDVFSLGSLWERAKSIFTGPIDRLLAFGRETAVEILEFVRDAILIPLARLAEGTRGYPLLKVLLGKDPITGEKVERTPDALVGGFMTFIGEQEVWENVKKANAIPRVWAWFQAAMQGLLAFAQQVPPTFMNALKSLGIVDLIAPPLAFVKVVGAFVPLAQQFFAWAGSTMWTILEIVFEVVSPQTLAYLKQTGAALKSILKNPLPFVRNLVAAAKLGFELFATNFLEHLKTRLIDWLVGSLPGVYIPKAFTLPEMAKFLFSVLGLTWANVRPKLVKVLTEPVVSAMETAFDIVVTLVTQGPAAAWEKIQEHLVQLKDQAIAAVTDMVVGAVVKTAVPKLVAMFIPGAGFVSAIISIYGTIKTIIEKIGKVVAVVKGFVDSIVAIAAGQIEGAAKRVEMTLANGLSLAISVLFGFLGLNDIAGQVMGAITKVRATVDKAIDALIAWIVNAAKSLFAKGKAAVGKLFSWGAANGKFKDGEGKDHTVTVDDSGGAPRLMVKSDPTAAREFVKLFVAAKKAKNAKYEAGERVNACNAAIDAAEKVVKDIEAQQKAKAKDEAKLLKLQDALLQANVNVADAMRLLVGKGKLPVGLIESYLLEGMSGTYGTIPKPKADNFTADHQPQAAVLEHAATFEFFGADGKLKERAKGRARKGFAINLHKSRHEAGRTFGSKGKSTKGEFDARIRPLVAKHAGDEQKQRRVIVDVIAADLEADVSAMREVCKPSSAYWEDIKAIVDDPGEREAMIQDVSRRINKGEDQIAAQNIDELVG